MLQIRTFGGLSVHHDRPGPGFALQPRRLAVLALIASAGERGITREKLLAILWPDESAEQGRRALTQALYALRKDLREEELFLGVQELRLNGDLAVCDVIEFELALRAGELEQADGLYRGPFLDGFRLPGAVEFERWVDDQRSALHHRYAEALERLARSAAERGEARAAVGWWRKLAALDPLHSGSAIGLIEALAAAGDRKGALQHMRIYEILMRQELDLAPDRMVVQVAERIRSEGSRGPERAPRPPPDARPAFALAPARVPQAAGSSGTALHDPALADAPAPRASAGEKSSPGAPQAGSPRAPARALPQRRKHGPGWHWAVVALFVAALMFASLIPRFQPTPATGTQAAVAVLAVGRITDYTDGTAGAAALADMLATNLARSAGLRVISTPRLYALLQRPEPQADFGAAALRAGAGLLVEGSIYRTAAGALRLDLRRIDLASGAVEAAYTVEGSDLFALADAGTERLVADLGVPAPGGSLAGLTTRSVAAYRLYEQGLRALSQGNVAVARPIFEAALTEDSTFAMAAYYTALTAAQRDEYTRRISRALRLAERASERERLVIRSNWAFSISSPELYALADSLVDRYPEEVEGYLYLGRALDHRGEFLAAVPHLQRAVAMDSLTLVRGNVPCRGCEALAQLVAVYSWADSLEASIRQGRRWVALQPASAEAWWTLALVLERAGHAEESLHAARRALELEPGRPSGWLVAVGNAIRTGDFATVDAELRPQLGVGSRENRSYARWLLVLSLRNQGRLAEALAEARGLRQQDAARPIGNSAPPSAIAEAQVLLEAGHARTAAALFDSIARWQFAPGEPGSSLARQRAWFTTHAANARATAGDTTALGEQADSVEQWARQSSFGRDHRLHHHLRGLLLAARGQDQRAADEFRSSLFSPTSGYSRTSVKLAHTLMHMQRPHEAVAVLQSALRGPLEASNYYVTHTELHEVLARAWDTAGRPDSAAAHYEWVARAWQNADRELQPRRAEAEQRLAVLRRGR